MNHCRYSCYNILSFTQRWMPLHCCHFRSECFHVPRGENDDIPPRSNDNIWNPGHGESWVRDCQAGSHCQSAAVTERGQNARTSDASPHATLCLTAASTAREPGRSQEGKVMANIVFEVSCHVKTQDGGKVGNKTRACQHLLETYAHLASKYRYKS